MTDRYTLHQGDCRKVLASIAENSVDSIVTDPPYELGFMGKGWDSTAIAHDPALWAEALRVAKPGSWLLAFGGTRTYHRLACAIEDAGWELRDSPVRGHQHQPEDCPWLGGWMFGSGFPKSHNGDWGGTALKPAWEPIVMARKPLIGTVEENWRKHGTGALNVDGCRVPTDAPRNWRAARRNEASDEARNAYGRGLAGSMAVEATTVGRWPANLIHDGSGEVLAHFPQAPGQMAKAAEGGDRRKDQNTYGAMTRESNGAEPRGDTGSAARFFYCAKASREDRNEGCEHINKRPLNWSSGEQNPGSFQSPNTDRSAHNFHPTVKPTDLMRWLVRLVTPRGGLVLDPFMGSGSTGKAAMLEGMRFIGCELQADYLEIARARIEFALRQGHQTSLLEAA